MSSASDATQAKQSSASTPQELTSILSQVQHLQSDRERLIKELEEAKEKMSKLQVLFDLGKFILILGFIRRRFL